MKKRGTADIDQQAYTTLRSFAKHRILNDMIETARRHTQKKDYIVMVLDKAALRVFSSCCKFFDVYKANVFQIERLEYKRKRYPNTDALYFISPTEESIKFLLQDFPSSDKNQYGGVHLCFTSHVSDELMTQLVMAKYLAPRVLSFNEINLDFFLYNDNVFHMSRKNVLHCLRKDAKINMPAV